MQAAEKGTVLREIRQGDRASIHGKKTERDKQGEGRETRATCCVCHFDLPALLC